MEYVPLTTSHAEATFGTVEYVVTPYDRIQAVREAVSILGGKPDILDVLRIAEYIVTGEDFLPEVGD